ncbi:DUF2026 family protein [Altererythrobacter sp. H2]|uniref:DUF2026 family protein n=1 Tax=Sphingomonadales TaxID=204457 RepID=UPI002B4BD9A3|nr:DUF2026 family protein [Altererythrobacter sp. H2]WRK95783.1 DUF2026 family protein [Altererythrobacter sp. H2]
MSKFVLPMPEYNRVHQIIHGVIKDEGNVERGCTFFSIVGSYLLNKHYGIAATAVAGGFALCVDDAPKCIFYGKDEGGKFSWGNDGFHMWVQTKDHVIDFMAPIYAESFAIAQPDVVLPRKMFQKRLEDDKQSLDDLQATGDYMVFPDPDLSEELIDHFLSRPINTDLLGIAEAWFGSRRGKQRPTISMGSNDGIVRHLTLPPTIARGAW